MAVQQTPSWIKSYAVIFTSLLGGASVVHNILKPDLTIPDLEKLESTSSGKPELDACQKLEVKKPANA